MAIQGIGGPGGPQRPERPANTNGVAKARSERTAPEDRVELSPEARRIAALAEAAMDLPEVRQDKVEALRKALESGTYEVDPRAVARALLEFEGEVSD